jgi:hypothetical protein
MPLASAARRLLLLLAAALPLLAGGGCYNMRNHETAPYIGDEAKLAKHLAERLPKSDLKVARALNLAASYRPPEPNALGEWEQVGARLVPLWPYARGEWAAPEIDRVGGLLERLLAPHFQREGEGRRTVLVEVGFTEETYRRYTLTVYGLSIYGGVSHFLGWPTDFGTVSLDAGVHVLDYLAEKQEDVEVHAGRAHGEETAAHGSFLLFFSYNALAEGPFMKGKPPITWDDLFAEAALDFVEDLLRTLGDAFPLRCGRCKLDFPADAKTCESCSGPLARRPGTREGKSESAREPAREPTPR